MLGNTEITAYHSPLVSVLGALSKVPGMRRLLGAAMVGPLRRTRFAFGGCFDDRARLDGEFGELFIDALRDRDVMAGQMRLLDGFDTAVIDGLAAVHARISCPTRLVWGRDDRFFPLERARAMLGELGGPADLVEIPGKVFAHEEYPEAFAEAALETLEAALSR